MKILYGSRNLPKLDRLSLYYWRVHMTVQVELKMQSVFFWPSIKKMAMQGS